MKIKNLVLTSVLVAASTSVLAAPYTHILVKNNSTQDSTLKRGLVCSSLVAPPTKANGGSNTIAWSTVTQFCAGAEDNCNITFYPSDNCTGDAQAVGTFNTDTGSLTITPDQGAKQQFSHSASGQELDITISGS